MKIRIDKQLNLSVLSSKVFSLLINGKEIFLFGDLSGIYINGKVINHKESLDKILKRISKNDSFNDLLINSIGSFVILVKEVSGIKIYISPRGPGFFYAEKDCKLVLFSNEKDFYKEIKNNGLHDFEVLHMLINHLSCRSPFTTIFKNTSRAVGGQIIEIRKNLQIKSNFYLLYNEYCTDYRTTKELSAEFKLILEGVTQNIFERNKRDKNYIMLSGGIDSSVILIAAKQRNLDIQALHDKKYPGLTHSVKILCDKLGVPMALSGTYFDLEGHEKWWEPYIEKSKDYYKASLGMLGIDHIYVQPKFYNHDSLFLGGQSFGVLYQGNAFANSSFTPFYYKRLIEDTIKYKPKRLLYTDEWRKATIECGFYKFFNKFANNYKIPKNSYEYLLSLILTYKFPLMPNVVLPEALKLLENDFIEYKSESVLKPTLGDDTYNSLKNGRNIQSRELSKLMRLLRFTTKVQSGTLNTSGCNIIGDFVINDPPDQGPMYDFLARLPITLMNAFEYKRLEFDYFKNTLNYDYFKEYLKDTAQGSAFSKGVGKVKKIVSRKKEIKSLSQRDRMLRSKEFKEHFLPEIDPNNSILIDMVENKEIKNYIRNLYTDIQNDDFPSFFMVNQILNMEIFLKEIF